MSYAMPEILDFEEPYGVHFLDDMPESFLRRKAAVRLGKDFVDSLDRTQVLEFLKGE